MYAIESIELKACDGLRLSAIDILKIDFKESITLILGRNGAGKSRLIHLLAPLAPTRSDLMPGGYKRMVVNHDNVRYELYHHNHNGKLKHSIKNLTDDVMVIEHANETVHNRTIEQLFGYTKGLHELITGELVLTKMRTNDRRHWFSKLSNADLSYALSFFKQSTTHLRNLSGHIKSLKESIGELRPRVLEREEDLQATRNRVEAMQRDLEVLGAAIIKTTNVANLDVDETELELLEVALNNVNNEVARLELYQPTWLDGYDEVQLQRSLASIDTNYQHALTQLEELKQRRDQLDSVAQIDVAGLEQEYRQQSEVIESLRQALMDEHGRRQFPELDHVDQRDLELAATNREEYCGVFLEAIKALAVDYPTDNLKQRFEQAKLACGKLEQELNQAMHLEQHLTARLKAYHETADVTCNNCQHVFKPGTEKHEHDTLVTKLGRLADEIANRKQRLAEAKADMERYGELVRRMDLVNECMRYYQSNRAVKVLFQRLVALDAFGPQGRQHLGLLTRFGHEVEQVVRINQLTDRIRYLNERLEVARAVDADDKDKLEQLYLQCEQRLEYFLGQRQDTQRLLDEYRKYQQRLARGRELESDLNRLVERHQHLTETLIENERYDCLHTHRQAIWDLLTVTKQRLDEMEREKTRLEDQEKQLAEAQGRHEQVKLIVDGLSPKSGILARYLYQCIERITNLMSSYVGEIWGYPMRILPCDISDADMDYAFPFWAVSPDNLKADVSHGSTAQKEVINFVFLLAVYRALGLEHFPLFIDELGSGFDEGHRSSMIDFLKQLAGSGFVSQVFMVSHDANSHFKLTNADCVVLNPEGITLPAVYNKNVEITYA